MPAITAKKVAANKKGPGFRQGPESKHGSKKRLPLLAALGLLRRFRLLCLLRHLTLHSGFGESGFYRLKRVFVAA
jgi:hypothetical protein